MLNLSLITISWRKSKDAEACSGNCMKKIDCQVAHLYFNICVGPAMDKHNDDIDVYFWQVQGITEWHVSGETILLPPGDLLIIKKGVYHKAIPKTPRAGISMSKL